MKYSWIAAWGLCLLIGCQGQTAQQPLNHGYPIDPVAFTNVKVGDGFWGQRLQASREVTVPLAFSKCEETGRYRNFEKAAHPSDTIQVTGFSFDDTDVYKTIEGASYLLQTYPDAQLERYIDSVLVIVAGAQEPDGYLYTARTMNPKHPHEWAGTKRWEQVEELSHEFYNLGHMLEAAVAHYQATGKRNFLDIAIRYADCVIREVGPHPDQVIRVPGHQIAEMGLAKLYLATGDKKYLDQAKFFLDYRGKTEHRDPYNQTHLPVLEQHEAVGHAVRATYMYAGMADVAALTGDQGYINAIDTIWNNIVSKKMYITGGIGSTNNGEAFGANYELPNATAYNETCAAIGMVYVNHRLFLLHGDAKYYDVLERTLYNGLISGVSLEGDAFFYPNPLAVSKERKYQRQAWFGCACCPSNISRFIPSLPGYVYAVKDNEVYVNLFMGNRSQLQVNGKPVVLSQETGYPYSGHVKLTVEDASQPFTLKVRIPGWTRNEVIPSDLYAFADEHQSSWQVKVNGQVVDAALQQGYCAIAREWRAGDVVEMDFDLQPRLVKANEQVEADRGRVAVQCGPLVYCAESPDNAKPIDSITLGPQTQLKLEWQPDKLHGINQIVTNDGAVFIPYYAWAHRGVSDMGVWIPFEQ
ncbi:MAG: glycoside hydrolase family 127 protein [Bacteroidaceae bacterium]|nr:glycoside hydrolase family 127 protein [Bacteroidaceae bacterium]